MNKLFCAHAIGIDSSCKRLPYDLDGLVQFRFGDDERRGEADNGFMGFFAEQAEILNFSQ